MTRSWRSSANINSVISRKFYTRRNNNNANSIETGRIIIAHLLPWNGSVYEHLAFLINEDKTLSSLFNLSIQFYLFAQVRKRYKSHLNFKGNF